MTSQAGNGRRGQNGSGSTESSPSVRWWRWRRQSNSTVAAVPLVEVVEETWSMKLDKICQQVAPYLPPLSASTRKAILCMVSLVLAWKCIIWTLELIVTGACFAFAVAILLCFLRPEAALWFVTQVLPPHVDDIRVWLSEWLMRAGRLLDRGPPGTSSLPLSLPPAPHPTPRSARTTVSRSLPDAALVPPANA